MKTKHFTRSIVKVAAGVVLATALAGCPYGPGLGEYEVGFIDGFMEDAEYWLGFSDSYDTAPDGPILYSGSDIPLIEDGSYDAGYWDGVWYAYNDGYFVSYDYAFTIGFSEGYDLAYRSDWYSFLAYDAHPEYWDGSFADGYHDGFSEGSVFGAWDYKNYMPFDWLDALWDYRDGTDLYLDELGFGTGNWGSVYLYEYGVDPRDYFEKSETPTSGISIRRSREKASAVVSISGRRPRAAVKSTVGRKTELAYPTDQISYRTLTADAREKLNVRPESSVRATDRALTLTSSWLERVNTYRASFGQ